MAASKIHSERNNAGTLPRRSPRGQSKILEQRNDKSKILEPQASKSEIFNSDIATRHSLMLRQTSSRFVISYYSSSKKDGAREGFYGSYSVLEYARAAAMMLMRDEFYKNHGASWDKWGHLMGWEEEIHTECGAWSVLWENKNENAYQSVDVTPDTPRDDAGEWGAPPCKIIALDD